MKYRMEAAWPMVINGFSTGCPPIHVSTRRSAVRHQNKVWVRGRNEAVRCFDVCKIGIINSTRIDAMRASTPPSLFGIDRRIA